MRYYKPLFLSGVMLLMLMLNYSAAIQQSIPFDTQITYIPLAQQLIEQGLAVFENPESVHVGPGSFVYMALAGADAQMVRLLNLVLALLGVVLVYSILLNLSGPVAASLGALAYASNPILQTILIEPLSEPPFLFFTLLWLWGLLKACYSQRPLVWVLVAAIGLSCSVLTRGVLFYWIYLAIVAAGLALIFSQNKTTKKHAKRILLVHLLSLVPIGLYIGHNVSQHDVPMIATGSGAALYFGNNPATAGYEPPYFGLYHDEWLVIAPGSHLTPENDKRLKFAALELIKELGVTTFVKQTVNKLAANVFFSRTGLYDSVYLYRAVRLFLVFWALYAFVFLPKTLLNLMLFSLLAYSITILAPVMYNFRYSIGVIELPLLIVAAMAVKTLVKKPLSHLFGACLALTVFMLAGLWHAQQSRQLMLDITHPVLRLNELAQATPDQVTAEAVGFLPAPELESSGSATRWLSWSIPSFNGQGASAILIADFARLDTSCTNMIVKFNDSIVRRYSYPVGDASQWVVGLTTLGLATEGGTLTLGFKCDAQAEVTVRNLTISAIQYGLTYRQRYEALTTPH